VAQVILDGWKILPELIGRELAHKIIALSNNPQPICAELVKFPQTLVHGDFHMTNLGLERGEKNCLILLDWARPAFTAPAVDIAFLLGINGQTLPITRDEAIALYRQNLARNLDNRYDPRLWKPQLELSLLAGFAMTSCF
jgi:aminoglycoside/choline kinase family phosphotransferase